MVLMLRASLFAVLLSVAWHVHAWKVVTSTNEMTGEKLRRAEMRSDNSLRLAFPYQGANRGTLTVIPVEGRVMVMVGVDKGQILCLQGCSITARFDDSVAVHFDARPAADLSTDYIVLDRGDQFVEWLEGARKIRVQISLFQNGAQVLAFTQKRPLSIK